MDNIVTKSIETTVTPRTHPTLHPDHAMITIVPTSTNHHTVPHTVHFVITDGGRAFFDWTRYVAIRAAYEQLKPDVIYLHVIGMA